MSVIVDRTDRQPTQILQDGTAGLAGGKFKPGHRRKVLGTGVAANASFSATFSGIPATAVVLRQGYHLSNAELGVALGLLGLGVALSELPWGLLTDRWGDRRVLLIGLGATATWLLAMAMLVVPTKAGVPDVTLLSASLLLAGLLGGSVNVLPLMLIVAGISVSAWHGVAYTELATLAGTGHVGTALSLANTFVFVGFFLVPMAIPGLLHLWSWSGVWLAASVCALIARPVFLRPAFAAKPPDFEATTLSRLRKPDRSR
ncbi:MFS transporter [Mesorhizobium sp. B2-3-5]|uniref:MFS transporter n=1 Tax=Mesorhizobium sp. B2-3-5 TaxID=2589958 RepID=UPI0011271EB4|nr:MFS transporter [Mesorhizobium sp. B2-3-5]TPM32739.1 MFS transporter [Mesorhizobium sp. B2-3-5]